MSACVYEARGTSPDGNVMAYCITHQSYGCGEPVTAYNFTVTYDPVMVMVAKDCEPPSHTHPITSAVPDPRYRDLPPYEELKKLVPIPEGIVGVVSDVISNSGDETLDQWQIEWIVRSVLYFERASTCHTKKD